MSENVKHNFGEYQAEFLGTFVFLLLGMGCVAGLKVAGASYGQWEISIIWGMAVALAIYLTAGVSGAHLNPAVTVALWLFACFDRRKVVPFISAQVLGAFCAAIVVYFLYHNLFAVTDGGAKLVNTASIFCTFPNPGISIGQAFMTEVVITATLMAVIMALTDDRNGVPKGPMAPLLIGILVATIGGSFGPLTGFAMNPARDFGPRLFTFIAGWGFDTMTGGLSVPYFLVPILAPIVGAVLGAFIYKRCIDNNLPCN